MTGILELLADAPAEALRRIEALEKQNRELLQVLEEVRDVLDDYSDADGDSEGFRPNKAMSALMMVDDALDKRSP